MSYQIRCFTVKPMSLPYPGIQGATWLHFISFHMNGYNIHLRARFAILHNGHGTPHTPQKSIKTGINNDTLTIYAPSILFPLFLIHNMTWTDNLKVVVGRILHCARGSFLCHPYFTEKCFVQAVNINDKSILNIYWPAWQVIALPPAVFNRLVTWISKAFIAKQNTYLKITLMVTNKHAHLNKSE